MTAAKRSLGEVMAGIEDPPPKAATLASALAELQTALPEVKKGETAKVPTKTGGSYSYSYASLADVSRAVLPLLGERGLSFSTKPTMVGDRFVLVYLLRHISGESDEGMYPLPDPTRATPQEIGSAITYGRRYTLCSVTGLTPAGDDDDAAAMSRQRPGKAADEPRPAARQSKPKPPPAEPRNPMDITQPQLVKLQAIFTNYGIKHQERAVRLAIVSAILSRPIASANEVTREEAGPLIDTLEALGSGENARAIVADEPELLNPRPENNRAEEERLSRLEAGPTAEDLAAMNAEASDG